MIPDVAVTFFFLYLSCTIAMNVIFPTAGLRWEENYERIKIFFLCNIVINWISLGRDGEFFVLKEHHLISAVQPYCTSFSSHC